MVDIKRIPAKINVFDYKVRFSYETRKGYYREQERTVKGFNIHNARLTFINWAQNQRTMTNVQILGMVEIFKNRQVIEL